LVSKVVARRDDVGAVLPYDEPDQLRAGIEDNLATLGVDQLTAVNLRVMDNAPPNGRFVGQLGALVAARDEGLIAGIGISNVTLQHVLTAVGVTDIVCVQNAYNLADRSSDAVLAECISRGIAFVPFCPLGWPKEQHDVIRTNPVVTAIAARRGATPAQIALAWLLSVANNVLLIPGTRSRSHLTENLAAGSLSLASDEIGSLSAAFSPQETL
jgi:aryl-alcohol dehydrogenase-like predicted oxidoreductase